MGLPPFIYYHFSVFLHKLESNIIFGQFVHLYADMEKEGVGEEDISCSCRASKGSLSGYFPNVLVVAKKQRS